MLVTFLKNHSKHKIDEEADLPEAKAKYLIRCRVVTVKADDKNVDKTLTDKLKKTKKKK